MEGGVLQQTNREIGRLRVLILLTVAPASATIIHIGLLYSSPCMELHRARMNTTCEATTEPWK